MVGAGVGTHPARVRTAVVREPPLVVLDRRGRDDRSAVAEALQGELLPLQFFLNGHAGVAFQDFPTGGEGLGPCLKMVPLDKDPFAAGQTVRFEDDAGELIKKFRDAAQRGKVSETRVPRDPVFIEEISGKGLRRFQPRQGLRRPHRRYSRRCERIHDAVAEGILGADDGKGDLPLLRKGDDRLRLVVPADPDLRRKGGDAGIVGFHEGIESGIPARPHESLGDRMLAGAVADKKDMGHRGLLPLLSLVSPSHTEKKAGSQTNPISEGKDKSIVFSRRDLICHHPVLLSASHHGEERIKVEDKRV